MDENRNFRGSVISGTPGPGANSRIPSDATGKQPRPQSGIDKSAVSSSAPTISGNAPFSADKFTDMANAMMAPRPTGGALTPATPTVGGQSTSTTVQPGVPPKSGQSTSGTVNPGTASHAEQMRQQAESDKAAEFAKYAGRNSDMYKNHPELTAAGQKERPDVASSKLGDQQVSDYLNAMQQMQSGLPATTPSAGATSIGDGSSAASTGGTTGQGYSDYSNEINAMLDAQKKQQLAELQAAYDKNMAMLQRNREDIAGAYNTQANDLAAQYERIRRNNNIQADLNGLNSGTASQMALADQGNYLSSFGQLRASEAADVLAADRQIADLEIGYRSAISQALANNDYERARALLEEYQRRDAEAKEQKRYDEQWAFDQQKYADSRSDAQRAWDFSQQQYADSRSDAQRAWDFSQQQYADSRSDAQRAWDFSQQQYADSRSDAAQQQALADAQQKAAYGDFSGYEAIYGKEVADSMRQYWIYNNPAYAYTLGMITADEYKKMTGRDAPGTSSGGNYPGRNPDRNSPLSNDELSSSCSNMAAAYWDAYGGDQLKAGEAYWARIDALNLTDEQRAIAGQAWVNYANSHNGTQG